MNWSPAIRWWCRDAALLEQECCADRYLISYLSLKEVPTYASVSTGQVQPGKLDAYLQLWRDSVAPAAQQLKGFKGAYVLIDREMEKGMTIAIYETKEDAQAVQTSGQFQELLAMLGDTLVRESVVRSGYEVSIHI